MKKYYIRFNPKHKQDPVTTPPWLLVELDPDTGVILQRLFAANIKIETTTWTETAFDGIMWWNITCIGKLIDTNNLTFKIVDGNNL